MTKRDLIKERGKRLQNLRKKVGLTRIAFAEQTGMSANTLKALELGDRELTPQKALLFSNLFSGLFSVSLGEDAHEARFESLYYGKKGRASDQSDSLNQENDDLRMQSDINFFDSNSSYALLTIQDDFMSPFYNKGDIVAGKKVINKKQFPLFQGHVCILETVEGNFLLRRIIKSEARTITACLLNTNVSPSINIVEEFEVRSIAQAIWHWHLSQVVRTSSSASSS
jgi:transcriptional regulator with XRE-family HTH domain